MERLTLACGGVAVNSTDDMSEDMLGWAGEVRELKMWMYISVRVSRNMIELWQLRRRGDRMGEDNTVKQDYLFARNLSRKVLNLSLFIISVWSFVLCLMPHSLALVRGGVGSFLSNMFCFSSIPL